MEVKAGYKQTEVGIIPEDWDTPTIENIIDEISMGPFGSDIKVSNFISSGIPVLNGANVASERLRDNFDNFVSPEKARSLKKAVARRGDIVVTHRGTIGQIAYIPDNSAFDRYVVSQSQFRVRFTKKFAIPAWVVLYFHSDHGSKRLLEGKGHTGVPAIAAPTRTFRKLSIPLPPIPEQQAIAEALSDADGLIEALEQLLAKKRQVKQGAMQELFTGKRRLPGFSEKWEDKQLGELAEMGSGGTPLTSNPNFYDGDIPWVSIGDMTIAGKFISSTERSLTADGLNNSAAQMFPVGTVLYAMYASLGECSIAEVPLCTSQAILGIRTKPSLHNEFLYYYLIFIKPQVKTMGQHGTQANLNKGMVQGFRLSLPSLQEQTAIAEILSDMDAEITALEAKLVKARQVKQGMMQELLTGRVRLV